MMTDKYHESSHPLGWGKRRSMKNSSTLYSGGYCDAAGIPLAAKPSIPREKRMMRAVAALIARAKGSSKSKTSALTLGSVSLTSTQLSKTNSADTSEETDQASDEAEESSPSRPRVSFGSEVTTVVIQQMTHEEVRKTFYHRSEYAAFRDAYRVHREASVDWCRSKDILPCNCEACRDDLAEGNSELHDSESASDIQITSDVAGESEHDSINPDRQEIENIQITPDVDGENEDDQEIENEPPSPAGVVSQDDTACQAPAPVLLTPSAKRRGEVTVAKKSVQSSNRVSTKRRHSRGHWRSWGGRSEYGGQTPHRSAPAGFSYTYQRQGGSLDDWGVNSRVQEAVRCHGAAYAYSTLRLQGFSDLYIRTQFLPDGGS